MIFQLLFYALALVGCAGLNPGEIRIPVTIPASFGNSVERVYSAPGARNCYFTLTDLNGNEFPFQSYSYSCDYKSSGYIDKVYVQYNLTFPGAGYLVYSY